MSRSTLELRQSQNLALTPQLQQSIRLLQLSAQDLEAELVQALADNPMLERDDEAEQRDEMLSLPADGAEGSSDGGEPDGVAAADLGVLLSRSEDERGYTLREGTMPGSGGVYPDDDDTMFPQAAASATLREHLLGQLATTHAAARDVTLVSLLIDELDENGLLVTPLEEVLSWLPEDANADIDELRAALSLLQSFDPPGIGARDLSECLWLQLREPDLTRLPEAADEAVLAIARRLCRDHLSLLASADAARLSDVLQCSDTMMRAAHALIRRLDPRPGRAWTVPAADYAVPDVIAHKSRSGQWRVSLNPVVVPRLRINELYAQALGQVRESGEGGHAALQSQLQQARWTIRAVEQRFDTLLRVSRAILARQRGFFEQGPAAMLPMTLKDIAVELDMHESTVSRATTQKFMLTPFGTMELKRFFGAGVATQAGAGASATAVQAHIRRLIDEENPAAPLSDSQLVQRLAEQGLVIARRTVAKYREALRIAPASVRKAQASLR